MRLISYLAWGIHAVNNIYRGIFRVFIKVYFATAVAPQRRISKVCWHAAIFIFIFTLIKQTYDVYIY